MSGSDGKVYEMLWDCRYCGARKLLGLTHRHCPNCGAPQDATARYFPSDAEKVAVQDHVYCGADVCCPACRFWNGRAAQHCGHCGGPLTAAAEARRRADQTRAAGASFAGETVQDARREFGQPGFAPPQPAQASAKRSPVLGIVLAVGAGLVLLLLVAVLWKKEGAFRVVGHSWKREIAIERFGPVRESAWCSEMPADAKQVSRRREVRSQRQVPDGQECETRRVDRGDGTFKEVQDCKAKTKSEPVYDDKCQYEVNRWSTARTVKEEGSSVAQKPKWPAVSLAKTGSCVGCEREGKRVETYSVRLAMDGGNEASCDLDEAKWAALPVGAKLVGKVGVMTGSVDCDSLAPK